MTQIAHPHYHLLDDDDGRGPYWLDSLSVPIVFDPDALERCEQRVNRALNDAVADHAHPNQQERLMSYWMVIERMRVGIETWSEASKHGRSTIDADKLATAAKALEQACTALEEAAS